MKLEDSLYMLNVDYEYGVRWLKSNEDSLQDNNIKDIISYILEKGVSLDGRMDRVGVDEALKFELNRYYKNVGKVVVEPIVYVPLLAKTEDVNYISYVNVLIEPLVREKVKEGKLTIRQYIDLVMTGSELQKRMEDIQDEFPDWYEQLKGYERKAMVDGVNDWFTNNSLGKKIKGQLSPHNLYHFIWMAGQIGTNRDKLGQIGVNEGNHGQEYRRWLSELGYTGHPVNYSLENKVGLYKWFKEFVLGNNLQPTEKEIQISARFLKMLEEEHNNGNIRAEDIHAVSDRGHRIAYKVGDYTIIFMGRVELFVYNKEVRVDNRVEKKLLDKSVHKILVRDMEKIVKMMVK